MYTIGRTVSAERVMFLKFQVKKGLEKRVCNIHTVSLQVFCSLPFSVIAYGEFQQCVLTYDFFREIAMFTSRLLHRLKTNRCENRTLL